MLDENLPTFFVKPSTEKPKFLSTLYLSQHGGEPEPTYSLRHLDPSLPGSKNRYAVALYDSFFPDVLYGEVLLIPKWTQPTLSQDAIRANGGVAPPPEPIPPSEFIIQLYNPDQQVFVRHKPKTWNSSAAWEFEMPQQTFRQPSSSTLDRTQSDPAASDVTPKLMFNWRKDGKLSKDLICYLSGKTVDHQGRKKKSREPDITVSMFQGLREITLYEPNFYRVEMEDFKGLEVVLILGAVVIRDVFFGHMKECFHITDPPLPGDLSPSSEPLPNAKTSGYPNTPAKQTDGPGSSNQPHATQGTTTSPKHEPQPPPMDPRTKWELEAEATQLKQRAEAEAREIRRREKEEEKKTKKLLEAEQKEARRRQAAVEQETERLRKLYGKEDTQFRKTHDQTPNPPLRINVPTQRPQGATPVGGSAHQRYSSVPAFNTNTHLGSPPQAQRPPGRMPGPSFSHFLSPPPQPPRPTSSPAHPRPSNGNRPQLREKKSFFGFWKRDDDRHQTLSKKKSAVF